MDIETATKAKHLLGRMKAYQTKRDGLANGTAKFIHDNGSGKREFVDSMDEALHVAFATLMDTYLATEIAKLEQELKEL